ncbi:MAG: hypothetical protein WAN36_10835, partial [Calditrichia bacterium]
MININRITQSLMLIFALVFALYGQIVPYDTLYNQTLTPSGPLKVSTHFYSGGFETNYSSYAADDFICTDQWTITKVLALGGFYNGSTKPQTFNLVLYANDNPNGNFPGTELFSYYN